MAKNMMNGMFDESLGLMNHGVGLKSRNQVNGN